MCRFEYILIYLAIPSRFKLDKITVSDSSVVRFLSSQTCHYVLALRFSTTLLVLFTSSYCLTRYLFLRIKRYERQCRRLPFVVECRNHPVAVLFRIACTAEMVCLRFQRYHCMSQFDLTQHAVHSCHLLMFLHL